MMVGEGFILVFTVLLLLALIVFACVVFTNAVEHLGKKLNLSEGAVGSVLAAVGTALPETIVPLVAIFQGFLCAEKAVKCEEIGVGAILGAPFLLGTLAMFVTGVSVYIFAFQGKRSFDMPVNTSVMKRDLTFFIIVYGISISASFFANNEIIKYIIVAMLIFLYFIYVYKTINDKSSSEEHHEELVPLFISSIFKVKNCLASIIGQIVLSLGGIIVLAHIFVGKLEHISGLIGINPLVLSLIVTPIATELPEKANSIIWIRGEKDTLALGNITGAMVFQSCIPTSIGILLTQWSLKSCELLSVALVYLSVLLIYFTIIAFKGTLKPWALVLSGVFYLIYLLYLLNSIFPCVNLPF